MNWIQRLGMRLAGVKSVATLVETWKEGHPTYPEVSYENMVQHGYRRNELIYACISKKANTAAQVRLKLYRKVANGDDRVLEDHPLNLLLHEPNPFMSEFDLWSFVTICQDLSGRAAFEKERDRMGRPVRLWPLRPDWLKPIPSSKTLIGAYQYTVPGIEPKIISSQDILDFKIFDPLNQFHSWPPVAVCARTGATDNQATDYIKLFFEKGASPPGIIKTTQKLRDPDVADIRRRWRDRYGGIFGWLEPAVLDRDAEYQKIGQGFNEMGFDVLDARSEARICMVLKVPPIMVGAKVGLDRSTFSNYSEARRAWWEDDLVPLYVDHLDTLEQHLLPEYEDDSLYLAWDFSEVPALREERLVLWQRANEGLRMGGLLVNEYRAELGMPSLGSAGQVFLRPLNMYEVPLRRSAEPIRDREDIPDQPGDRPDDQIPEKSLPHSLSWGALSLEDKRNALPPDWQGRIEIEKELGETLEQFLSEQKKRVAKAIREAYPSA